MTDHHPSALIAEDEPLLAAALQAELARLWPALSVVATVADGASAVTQALALRPSVCFLDIRMPGLSGLEAAQALVEDWPDAGPFPLLVFVTAYDQYAVQAFESQAVDYLLKPVQSQRLAACVQRLQVRLADRVHAPEPMPAQAMPPLAGLDSTLDRTLETLRALLAAHPAGFPVLAAGPHPPQPRLDVIQAGVGSTVHMVPVADVIYFEAADKYVRVVTAEREHLIRLSLRELQPQLDAQLFWQVHRGLVVRASAITTAVRDESGKILLSLRGRSERLSASRLYAHLFKSM